jgi:hypothetical protein
MGINFSSLDKVLAYKTIEGLDEAVAMDVAVACNCPRFDGAWGGAEFGSLAQHTFQLVRGEQHVFLMFLIKDIMDCVACAS